MNALFYKYGELKGKANFILLREIENESFSVMYNVDDKILEYRRITILFTVFFKTSALLK